MAHAILTDEYQARWRLREQARNRQATCQCRCYQRARVSWYYPEVIYTREELSLFFHRADLLLRSNNNQSGSKNADLRSGLYFVARPVSTLVNNEVKAFIVYWPEATTWEDGTTSSVAKNRATFMR